MPEASPSVSPFVLEKIVSGPALAQAYGSGQGNDAGEVLSAAARGDRRALEIVALAASLLGNAIGQLANCLDPEAIVVGGGLGSASGPYWVQLQEQIGKSMWSGVPTRAHILQSSLGADAGLIGAALAVDAKLT